MEKYYQAMAEGEVYLGEFSSPEEAGARLAVLERGRLCEVRPKEGGRVFDSSFIYPTLLWEVGIAIGEGRRSKYLRYTLLKFLPRIPRPKEIFA